jgi:DNA-3-methyladenine glycosylase I
MGTPQMSKETSVIVHEDGRKRCPWPGIDPLYVHYHDTDWGVPEFDSRALFEKLILDGFQAGLSWITILRKREDFRKAFDGFEPSKIAQYNDKKIESLMQNAGIIRNRAKIIGTIKGAQLYLDMQGKQDFSDYLWSFSDGRPRQNHFKTPREVPTQDALSQAISKDLKRRGFTFVGPTIIYAFMQAVGMVNDHLVDCFRHEEVRAIGEKL